MSSSIRPDKPRATTEFRLVPDEVTDKLTKHDAYSRRIPGGIRGDFRGADLSHLRLTGVMLGGARFDVIDPHQP